MLILKIALIGVLFFVVPYIIGNLFIVSEDEYGLDNAGMALISGFVVMLGTAQIIVVPIIFTNKSFLLFLFLWGMVQIVFIILAIIKCRNRIWKLLYKAVKGIWPFQISYVFLLLLILVQMAVPAVRMHLDEDDATYVALATQTLATDTIYVYDEHTGHEMVEVPWRYVLSPQPVFWAACARLTGINASAFCHTVLPPIIILFVYILYYQIGCFLFKGDRDKVRTFLFFLCIMNMFGGYSRRSTSSVLFYRIWQGKAMLATFLLPFLFLLGNLVLQRKEKIRQFLLVALAFACCLASSMGIMLAPLLLGCITLYYFICNRKLSVITRVIVPMMPMLFYGAIYLLFK